MTGFSTPRETLCRQPMRSQNATRTAGADAHRWAGTQRSDAAPDAHRPDRDSGRAAPAAAADRGHHPDAAHADRGTAAAQPNGMMRAPQSTGPAGARFEQPRSAPTPPPRPAPAPAPSQHFAEAQAEANSAWRTAQSSAGQPATTSAATIGNHRAIDALSHVGVKSAVKMPSRRGWRHMLYLLTRINLGLSPDELYEMDLHTRIRRNARDSYQIGVFGLKGGVGKTAVTVALGSALSKVRGDRILAVDADPDGGNLADRAGRQSAATVSDLLADKELARYNDIRAYTSMNASNLEILSSEEYSGATARIQRRRLEGRDQHRVALLQPRAGRLRRRAVPAGRARSAVDGVGSGDRRERVDRRRPAGRGDDGLVAAERISGSARPLVRGDQPRRAG